MHSKIEHNNKHKMYKFMLNQEVDKLSWACLTLMHLTL